MPLALNIVDRERRVSFFQRHHVARLELFGSRDKGTAMPDSNVNVWPKGNS